MNRNTKLHLKGGAAIAAGAAATLWVAGEFGPGYAVAFACTFVGIGVEIYQMVRREGTPAARDAALSAIPGIVAGVVWELWRAFG